MQIISGTDIRCTWDGRGGISHQIPINSTDDTQEAQVHFVMNSADPVAGTRSKNIVQHVCELIPTVPLFPAETPVSSTASQFPPRQGYQDGYNPSPTHQYTNSYGSSLHSSAPSGAPTIQSFNSSPAPSQNAYQHSIASSQLTQQGYSPSPVSSPQSYSLSQQQQYDPRAYSSSSSQHSQAPQQQYDPRIAQTTYSPQHQYPSQSSIPYGYNNVPGYQPAVQQSQIQGNPQSNAVQYSRGGYTSNLAPTPQHDLRHSHSWRS